MNGESILRIIKWVAIVFLVVLTALVIFLSVYNWNSMRGYIGEKVSEKYGRKFTINGNLEVDFFPFPLHVRAEQVHLANADWGTGGDMLDLQKIDFSLSLLSLLKGEVVLPEVSLTDPQILLEVSPDGKRNWILDTKNNKEGKTPRIEILSVNRGTLTFRDPTIKTDMTVNVSPASALEDARQSEIKFSAQGKFKGLATKASGQGGKVMSLFDMQTPYPVKGEIEIGETHISVDGTVTGLSTFAAVDAHVKVKGNDLAALSPLITIPLPASPPYKVSGQLIRTDQTWKFNKFSGMIGDSDIAGDFNIDVGGKKPFIRANLVSRQLDLDDLGGLIGAPPQTGAGETASPAQKKNAKKVASNPRVLPDMEFKFERLNTINADVKLSATSIRGIKHPLDDLKAHMKILDGKVTLEPLNFGVAGGNVISNIVLNTAVEPHTSEADITIKKLELNKLFPTVKLTNTSIGLIGGRAKFHASGNSIAKLLGSAEGQAGFSMAGGHISNLLLEIIGIDGAEIIKFLLGGDKTVAVRCMVADFKVNDGVMSPDVLVLDTDDTNIVGEGTVNLKNETLDLVFKPLPKDMSFLSARSPLFARGTFKNPKFSPDMKKVASRTGAAVVLGTLLTPLAAILPLIETGPGKDSDCADLLAHLNKSNHKLDKTPSPIQK